MGQVFVKSKLPRWRPLQHPDSQLQTFRSVKPKIKNEQRKIVTHFLFNVRGRQDSNLRTGYKPVNRLAGGPNRPLWHLPRYAVVKTERSERDSNPR